MDAVKAEGNADYAHHITPRTYIHNLVAHQQPWDLDEASGLRDWVSKGNRIIGTGTDMYFGNSDGSAPFIGGLIEGMGLSIASVAPANKASDRATRTNRYTDRATDDKSSAATASS